MKRCVLLFMIVFFIGCQKDDAEPNEPKEPEKRPIESISMDKDTLRMKIGDLNTLECAIAPTNVTDSIDIEWILKDNDIVSITRETNKRVIVSGTNQGKTTLIARLKHNALISDTCFIEIMPILSTGINLSATDIELLVGQDSLLNAKIMPNNVTDRGIIWSSSDENIVTVNEGLVVAVAAGEAIVMAKSADGAARAECNVVVKNILVENVGINEFESFYKEDKFMIGTQKQLTYYLHPNNAFNKGVYITSSNESVIRIDENMILYAVSSGDATITICSKDGGAKKSYNVTAGDITLFVTAKTGSGGTTNMFGYVTADIECYLDNQSDEIVNITSMYIVDNNDVIHSMASVDDLGLLNSHSWSKRLNVRMNNLYYPRAIWVYEYNGQKYEAVLDFARR